MVGPAINEDGDPPGALKWFTATHSQPGSGTAEPAADALLVMSLSFVHGKLFVLFLHTCNPALELPNLAPHHRYTW